MAYFEGSTANNFGGISPTGNFSPAIFSQKVLMFFRTASVVEGITNTDYFGEISGFGDTVRVIKEPVLTVSSYTRGQATIAQTLVDDEITLEISKANYFQFNVDDIEKKLAHVNWQSLAQGSATYALKNSYDREVLEYMATQCAIANIANVGATVQNAASIAEAHREAQENSSEIIVGFDTGETDPSDLLSTLALKLDEADIPEEGRWVVVTPRFIELLARTSSLLMSSDYNQGSGGLRNGLVSNEKLRGFSVYKTNNCPVFDQDTVGATPTFTPDDDTVISSGDDLGGGSVQRGDVIMAGHMSAVATANAIDKAEIIRSETTFADIVRGLHVYGRGILYPEALAVAYVVYG